jgi:hypothetical protein
MENRETKSMLEGGSLKGCENVRNKDLVVYSYEQRRIEATFKGDQDSYRVAEPMMMMVVFGNVLYFSNKSEFSVRLHCKVV